MHRYLGDVGQLFPICLSKIAGCACRQAFMENCVGGVASFKFRSIPLEWTILSLRLVFPSRMGGEHRLTQSLFLGAAGYHGYVFIFPSAGVGFKLYDWARQNGSAEYVGNPATACT